MRQQSKLKKHTRPQRGIIPGLPHPPSIAFYDKKPAEHKPHKQAVIALARRRLDILYVMLRAGTFYQDPDNARGGTYHRLAT